MNVLLSNWLRFWLRPWVMRQLYWRLGWSSQQIADRFNVTRQRVWQIIRRP